MAEYIPINVANELELKQALKLERTVIAVKNDDIRRSIQKKYQKTAKAKGSLQPEQ